MVCSDRSTDQGHRLTTQPRRARPEEPEVEEPARAGGSTTPSSPNRTKTTRIIDQESPVVDQGSEVTSSIAATPAVERIAASLQ